MNKQITFILVMLLASEIIVASNNKVKVKGESGIKKWHQSKMFHMKGHCTMLSRNFGRQYADKRRILHALVVALMHDVIWKDDKSIDDLHNVLGKHFRSICFECKKVGLGECIHFQDALKIAFSREKSLGNKISANDMKKRRVAVMRCLTVAYRYLKKQRDSE